MERHLAARQHNGGLSLWRVEPGFAAAGEVYGGELEAGVGVEFCEGEGEGGVSVGV